MSPTRIETLAPEQAALIPVYRDKWRAIWLSTAPIDRQKADAAVKAAYKAMGREEPDTIFLSSPDAIADILAEKSPERLAGELGAPLLTSLSAQVCSSIREQIGDELWMQLESLSSRENLLFSFFALQQSLTPQQQVFLEQIWLQWQDRFLVQYWEQQQTYWREKLLQQPGGNFIAQIGDFFWTQWGEPLSNQLEETVWKPLIDRPIIQQWQQPWLQIIGGMGLLSAVSQNFQGLSIDLIDFCINVLNCPHDRSKWLAWQSLVSESGWYFPLEKACIICDRPRDLHFDSEHRFHAEGKPAIQFSDGCRVYAYHGVRLPEQYGKLHPHQWQATWLLQERNAELRRVLIQGIGYGRICQELQAEELDFWREYVLLKIDNDVDIEPIYLLKMTCPSTGHIHATRVPPDIRSAREAIRWVNWGTDPSEFSVQT